MKITIILKLLYITIFKVNLTLSMKRDALIELLVLEIN